MVDSLFGEDFDIVIPETKVKNLINKAKDAKLEETDPEKILKSKKLALQDRLNIITTNVLKVLGKQKNNILVIKDKETFDDYITAAINSGRIAIDTETNNSLDPVTCRLMGPCFYYPGGKQVYVPINHRDPCTKERYSWQLTEQDCAEELKRIIDSKIDIIMHNGKFDYEVLKCTCGVEVRPSWDTMIGARLLNENEPAGLKWQYRNKIDPTQEKYDIEHLFENIAYADVDPEIFAYYAATDAFITDKLYELQKEELDKPEYGPHMDLTGKHEVKGLRWLFHEVEMPIVIVTAEMELRGVKVDTELGERLKIKYNSQLETIDTKIKVMLENLNPLIEQWKLSREANEKTRMYVAAKSKMTVEKIEQMYPLIDADGNRYKIGKTKVEQLETPINLASPTQLAILFYDILKCPAVSKKSLRSTGEGELKSLVEALTKEETVNLIAKNVAACLLATGEVIQEIVEVDQDKDEFTDIFEDFIEEEPEEEVIITNNTNTFDISSKEVIIKQVKALLPSIIELINALLKRRGIVKLITTYIDVIPELAKHWPDGRIRFTLRSIGTDTGRYSSGGTIKYWDEATDSPVEVSGINIQNQPAKGNGAEIRLLYKADTTYNSIDSLDGHTLVVPEITEVETTEGYKYCSALTSTDKLLIDGIATSIQQVDYNSFTREYSIFF